MKFLSESELDKLFNDMPIELKNTLKSVSQNENISIEEKILELQKAFKKCKIKNDYISHIASFGLILAVSIIEYSRFTDKVRIPHLVNWGVKATKEKQRKINSNRAKKAADTRHNQPNGSREKREIIKEIWQTGKYKTRDRCAEAEHEKLGLSFKTARNALKGTPNP